MASHRRPARSRAQRPNPSSRRVRDGVASSRPRGRRRGLASGSLAGVGVPLRLALTLSFAGLALAGAAWRAGWRS